MVNQNSTFTTVIRTMVFLFLLCCGLYFAKSFLVPIVFGSLLAMLLVPLSAWMERKGVNKALAAILCVLLLIAVVSGLIALLSWQVAGIAKDADQISEQLNKLPGKIQEYIHSTFGVSTEAQQKMMKEQSSGMSSKAGAKIAGVAGSVLSLLGTSLVVTIYIFLFIYYRNHLEDFVLKLAPTDNREQAKKIMTSSSKVAQQYIRGLGMMIATLWVMYGIGFSIIGVRHALFFAVLCGLLEIVPFVGNLTGTLITALMAFNQGDGRMVLWVLVVYAIVQFTQTYLLEPLIVGARVSINPLCTIIVIIVGEMIWGIPGMILAIPMLAIVKIICDNIPALKPFGFLIGEVKERGKKPRNARH